MVQSLEAIKGGGGSIRVGTTGTISSLMTRELDSMKTASQEPSSSTPRKCSGNIGPSSTIGSGNISLTSQDIARKTKGHVKTKNRHRIPMLGSDNMSFDGTPSREKSERKGAINIVEVVDIKCGSLDSGNRAWTVPITSKLRKLGFSKLSESIV